jgi:hypothetical protein
MASNIKFLILIQYNAQKSLASELDYEDLLQSGRTIGCAPTAMLPFSASKYRGHISFATNIV